MWPGMSTPKWWLHQAPTDMRQSFDGLSALVRRVLGHDPQSGELFVFVNRRKTQMRVLYFAGDGYCLWSKRLERGQFQVSFRGGSALLDETTWKLLVAGIDLGSVRQLKRYRKPSFGSTADHRTSIMPGHESAGASDFLRPRLRRAGSR